MERLLLSDMGREVVEVLKVEVYFALVIHHSTHMPHIEQEQNAEKHIGPVIVARQVVLLNYQLEENKAELLILPREEKSKSIVCSSDEGSASHSSFWLVVGNNCSRGIPCATKKLYFDFPRLGYLLLFRLVNGTQG